MLTKLDLEVTWLEVKFWPWAFGIKSYIFWHSRREEHDSVWLFALALSVQKLWTKSTWLFSVIVLTCDVTKCPKTLKSGSIGFLSSRQTRLPSSRCVISIRGQKASMSIRPPNCMLVNRPGTVVNWQNTRFYQFSSFFLAKGVKGYPISILRPDLESSHQGASDPKLKGK